MLDFRHIWVELFAGLASVKNSKFGNKVSTLAIKNVMQCDLVLAKRNDFIGGALLIRLSTYFLIGRWSVRIGQGIPINIRLTA